MVIGMLFGSGGGSGVWNSVFTSTVFHPVGRSRMESESTDQMTESAGVIMYPFLQINARIVNVSPGAAVSLDASARPPHVGGAMYGYRPSGWPGSYASVSIVMVGTVGGVHGVPITSTLERPVWDGLPLKSMAS